MQHQQPEQHTAELEQSTFQLMAAVEEGNAEEVLRLIAKGIDVQFGITGQDAFGRRWYSAFRTPLVAAAARGYLTIVKALHAAGANIEDTDDDGNTPLLAAATNNHVDVVQYLLSVNANVNAETKHGYIPLTYLVAYNQLALVKQLLQGGANTSHSGKTSRITPLCAAAKENNLEMVKLLLEYKADPNIGDVRKETPLMHAIGKGHEEVVACLLDAGADPKCKNEKYDSAFSIACCTGHYEIVQVFLERRLVDIFEYCHGEKALIYAAEKKSPELLKKLLVYVGELTPKIKQELALAMIQAAKHMRLESVKILLATGIDINNQDKNEMTALMGAAKNSFNQRVELLDGVMQYLIASGAGIEVKDYNGDTALSYAMSQVDSNTAIHCCKVLLDADADINTENLKGQTPLMIRILQQKDDKTNAVMRFLLARGADVHATNNVGDTVMMYVARKFSGEQFHSAAKLLIESGADPAVTNKNGNSPVDYLIKNGRTREAKVLIKLYNEYKSATAITFCRETHFVKRSKSAPTLGYADANDTRHTLIMQFRK